MAKNNYYGVKRGKEVGIFSSWAECSKQIHGFKGAMYKGFVTLEEAEAYMKSQESISSEGHKDEDSIYSTLEQNEMMAYVDGSNVADGSKFSFGMVGFFLDPNNKRHKLELSGVSNDPRFTEYRNISGELFAAVNTVKKALELKVSKLYIYHDYSGIRHWALNEWKTKNHLSENYSKFMNNAMKSIDITFVKVKGHTGDKYNEEVDKLVKKALGIL